MTHLIKLLEIIQAILEGKKENRPAKDCRHPVTGLCLLNVKKIGTWLEIIEKYYLNLILWAYGKYQNRCSPDELKTIIETFFVEKIVDDSIAEQDVKALSFDRLREELQYWIDLERYHMNRDQY